MNKTIKIVLGLIVVIAVVWVGVTFPKIKEQLGANPGPVLAQTISLAGYELTSAKAAPIQASTTICALKSPNATSTLLAAGVKLDTSTTSAFFIEIAQATTPFATTTLIGTKYSVAASAKVTIQASTTPTATDATLFAPNTYLVAKWVVAGGAYAATNNAPKGTCEALWAGF
jgi:hypothetical protein